MCVSCFGLVVSIFQMIGSKDPAEDALCDDKIISTKPSLKRLMLCIFSFRLVCYHLSVSPWPLTFYTPILPICAESAVIYQPTNQPTNIGLYSRHMKILRGTILLPQERGLSYMNTEKR